MAAGQHKLSRRALLAGGCATSALLLVCHAELGSASTSPLPRRVTSWTLKRVQGDGGAGDGGEGEAARVVARWRRAFACYARAEAEVEGLAHVDDDAAYDRALGRHNAALARLLRAPAPDVAAAAGKLELILRHQVFELSFGEACLAALGRDLRGFSGGRAAPFCIF